jgi:aryl-alcohol dehydrogenase-like predicted oxidoreductase
MNFTEKRTLGKTDLKVGPLGVASSYGAPASAFEEAFDRGCNYFYWGSLRKGGMRDAIRHICGQGNRDELVIVVQSYSRSASLMQISFERALKSLGLDHADILVLGWHNKVPAKRIMDKAVALKERGLFRFLGLSGHNRSVFPDLARLGVFDLFHIRYNAANRGAEQDIFPHIQSEARPGIVSYTATRWGQLLNPKRTPPEESVPLASDCYRFALTNPAVDVCVCGPRDMSQMKEALKTVELGPLSQDEMSKMIRLGDYVYSNTGRFVS